MNANHLDIMKRARRAIVAAGAAPENNALIRDIDTVLHQHGRQGDRVSYQLCPVCRGNGNPDCPECCGTGRHLLDVFA